MLDATETAAPAAAPTTKPPVWTERLIATAIARQTLAKKCIVLVDNCNWTGYECDVLAVHESMRIIDVEVKISRADLKADAAKDKWWHRYGSVYSGQDHATGRSVYTTPPPTAREWPPKVWKHYYAMPQELWDDCLFGALPSPHSGVLLLRNAKGFHGEYTGGLWVECVRRATPNKAAPQISAAAVTDIARLANLRMWNAYEQLAAGRKAA